MHWYIFVTFLKIGIFLSFKFDNGIFLSFSLKKINNNNNPQTPTV